MLLKLISRNVIAGLLLVAAHSSLASAHPRPRAVPAAPVVDGSCPPGTPNCPFATLLEDLDDIEAATSDGNGPCAERVDLELLAKFRAGRTLTSAEFVRLMAPMAQASERRTGVPASVTIAQAALETGWGKSARRAANNLFGIKGSGTSGSVKLWTREYIRGRWVKVRANFAAYDDMTDSVVAHAKLISEKDRYAKAMAVRNDPNKFAVALQKAGYATDPSYAKKLQSIMNKHDLRDLDDSRACV